MGLSFSVPKGVKVPPSLVNIYKEISQEYNCQMNYSSGDLTYLAKQGVLLLNSILSVRAHQALSHNNEEYRMFLARVLEVLDTQTQPIVFMLWGNFAQKYQKFVANPERLILKSVHPSPLGANHGGWFGLHQFSRCNDYLISKGLKPIDWQN